MKAMTLRAWMCGLVLAATTVGATKEQVSMQVFPEVSFAPANLVIRTRIAPDADNRALEVVADSAEFYRSSTIPLEGDRAPKSTTVQFLRLPSGAYEVTVALLGAGGQRRALARAKVNVIESALSR